MQIYLNITISLLFSAVSAFGQWNYVGIPYVTDNVPSEIMPAIPDGADIAAFPYDPCTVATPTFADGALQYYIDTVNGNDGSAGNSGRGSVALPRQTIPNWTGGTWTIADGEQFFITDNSTVGTDGEDIVLDVSGSSGTPCWIIGVGTGKPTIQTDKFFLGGTHIIMDSLKWSRNGSLRIKFGNSTEDIAFSYGTIRNCEVDGQGASNSANAAIGASVLEGSGKTNSFICIYNNVIHSFGDWDRADDQGTDHHAIQMTRGARYWWIVDNEIYHCEGDSIQVNTSNQNDATYINRPHYIYVAGNEMYENYEQALDAKNCFHLVVSGNDIHDFYNTFVASGETALLLCNDSEGWVSGYEWAINNTIYDAGRGIRLSGNTALTVDDPEAPVPVQTAGQRSYVIGNQLTNVDVGVLLDMRGNDPTGAMTRTWYEELWVVDNTIDSLDAGVQLNRTNSAAGETHAATATGNVIYNRGTSEDLDLGTSATLTNTVTHNVIYRSGGSVSLNVSDFDVYTNNVLDSDPLFTALGTDYSLTQSSPAVDAGTLSPVYALFQSMYGIDITPDLNGDTRPQGASWDAGAYEYNAVTPATAIRSRGPAMRTVLSAQ